MTLLLQDLHPIRYLFRTQHLQGYFVPRRHRKNSPAYFKSIKANWKGGTVILDIENRVREGGPDKIDREILVSISDDGEDIDTKIVPSLFFKIVSTYSSKGTGLGLFMSKVLWNLMVGRYGVEIMTIVRVQHLPLVYRCEKSNPSI
ncbi:MAG: ATP-binding protein [Thermoproteota archaeon]|nr:ATP-binding protein [Thermoproteota archaeon]